MSPAIKIENQDETKHLKLSPLPTPEPTSKDASMEETMQLIYALLILVGENMSAIQNTKAENQLDMAKAAQNSSEQAQKNSDQTIQNLDKYEEEKAAAHKWGIIGIVIKAITAVLGVVIGALLSESAIGLTIIAATIAFTASPLFDKTVQALSAFMPQAVAQFLTIVIVTVLSAGAEAGAAALSGGVESAVEAGGETGVEDGIQTGLKDGVQEGVDTAANTTAETVTQTLSEQAADETTMQISNETEEQTVNVIKKEAEKVTETQVENQIVKELEGVAGNETTSGTSKLTQFISKVKSLLRTYSGTYTAFTQTFLSSGLIQEGISAIPGGSKQAKEIAGAVLTVILGLAVSLGGAAAGSGNSEALISSTVVKSITKNLTSLTAVVGATGRGYQGHYIYEQGNTQKDLAPIQGNAQFERSWFSLLNQISSDNNQTFQSLIASNNILFKTDFSEAWAACVEAQQA